jgi:protein BCP1
MDPTPDTPEQTESSSGEDSGSEDEGVMGEGEQEIQVEFEARTPEERDLPGIISLLRQCFRGSEEIDVSALARFVMKQRSVGSVVTQSPVTDDDDDDEELGGHDGEVFGLATIVRLRETEVADQIIRYLTKSVTASDPRGQLSRLLSSPDIDIGLIISERIINMPPQISVPLYQTLSNEVRKARAKNLPFNFTHYLLISKVLLPSVELPQAGVMYANAEEEVFIPECDLVLEMNIKKDDQETRVVTISQEELVEKKKVMVFKAERLDKIVGLVKNAFPIS